MKARKTVIAGYVRSPFTPAKKGALAGLRPDELSVQVIQALLKQVDAPTDEIEDVIWGCAYPEGEQGLNIGRIVSMLSGLPVSVSGVTVNRWCGSALQSVQDAAGMIATSAGEAFICGGVESMSRVPMFGFNISPPSNWTQKQADDYMKVGLTAERIAQLYGVTRDDQDRFSFASHVKALAARAAGRFDGELTPIKVGDDFVTQDGCPRESTLAKLAELKPVFLDGGTVTAGSSSPMTDGATALFVCSEQFAVKHGLKPLSEVVSFAVAGCPADVMGIGPVAASRKALNRAGLTIDDIDVVEMNEAFAAQAEACRRELRISEGRFNSDGGGIAIGHPLGATGGRLVGKASLRLQRGEGHFALATQCIGGGMGIAMVLGLPRV